MRVNYSNATIKLHEILENEEGRKKLNETLSFYPLYSPKTNVDLIPTRDVLNEKLLNHYRFREIGQETIGQFLFYLKSTMNEIMPYYNELFKTVEIMSNIQDPFGNVDVTETFEQTRNEKIETEGNATSNHTGNTTQNGVSEENGSVETNGTTTNEVEGSSTNTGTSSTTGTNEKTRKFSDTPQNSVGNLNAYLTEYSEDVENVINSVSEGSTTSNTNKVDETTSNNTTNNNKITTSSEGETSSQETSSSNGSSEGLTTIKQTMTKKGNQGVNTYAHDMIEFRETIRDITNEIINDYRIKELFMMVD